MTDTSYGRSLPQREYYDGGDGDGALWSKNPRACCFQQPIQRTNGGQVVTYQATLSPSGVAATTAAEQSLTVGTTAGNGLETTDFLLAVNKPTAQAGLGNHTGRISTGNTMYLTFSNTSSGTLTPTASQVYNVTVIRGAIYNSQTLTPTAVPASGTSEQVFTIAPVNATFALTVNANDGGIDGASVVYGGSGYYRAPSMIVADAVTGCGIGAVLRADVNSSGVVTQVKVLKRGKKYVSTATATAVGGNVIEQGMFPFVVKPSCDAGIAISNVRVQGKNQIAIQYANYTGGALTPTSEAYKILCLNDIPAISNLTSYGVIGTGLVAVASTTSAEQSVTVSGLAATDIFVGAQKPTLSAGIGVAGGRCAANAVYLTFVNASAAAVTPSATEIYGVTVYNQSPVAPLKVYAAVLTPVSVAATTSAEQTFTVTGLPMTNSTPGTVWISKPSHQYGLAMGGARISAQDTLALNYENLTGSAITPVSETYLIACLNGIPPLAGGWVALPFSQSLQQSIESANEDGDTFAQYSFQAGA